MCNSDKIIAIVRKSITLDDLERQFPGAPEAVWQVWRSPYQSKIWYGDAIPIKSRAANFFIIWNKSRMKTSAFLYISDSEPWVLTKVAKIQSTRTGLRLVVVYIYGEYTKSI